MRLRILLIGIFLFFQLTTVAAAAERQFYEGQTLRFIVASSVGGGWDTYTRLVAKHIGKYIPGNPTTFVENRPGAGGLVGVMQLYHQTKPDGLTLGSWQGGLALQQYLGSGPKQFDPTKFEVIGVPVGNTQICVLNKSTGIITMDTWMNSRRPVKLAGLAPGSPASDVPRVLSAALRLPMQLVDGYKGGAEARLAIESGEADGMCGVPWEVAKATWQKLLPNMTVVLQVVSKPHADLPNVPLAVNFAKTQEARQLVEAGIQDPSAVSIIFTAPPGTPKENTEILRAAFAASMKDSDLLAEAKKARLDIDPLSPDNATTIISSFAKLDGTLLNKLNEVLVPKK
jgi:tripartite-type tricarboxylate transporter receptor subunit TctC